MSYNRILDEESLIYDDRFDDEDDFGCFDTGCNNDRHWNLTRFPLAMAYVPMQPWEKPYDLETGLRRGTIFPKLDLPFYGGEAE